ncbi:MAG: VanZ family protein [Pseudooceanicola sp.]
MTPLALVEYAGLALVYAVIATVIVRGGLLVFGCPRARIAAVTPALFLTSLFVALTHHPLPDRALLDCSQGGIQPILEPFRFIRLFRIMWNSNASLGDWLQSLLILAPVMNLLVCVAIGAALAGVVRRLWQAVLFGTCLSGLIELSQLTGVFGLYPCAWRYFELDDLILNIGGIAIGYLLVRAFRTQPVT